MYAKLIKETMVKLVQNNKNLIADKIVVLLWIAFLIINVIPNFIISLISGVGNMAIIYLFLLYFYFLYGKNNCVNRKPINTIAFFFFVIGYVFIMQFLYKFSEVYVSFGVAFSTEVWNMISYVPIVLSAVFIANKSDGEMRTFIKYCFIFISLFIAITSIFTLINDFSLAKHTATGHGEFIPLLVGYDSVSAFAIIIPLLILNVSNAKKKFLAFIYLFIIFLCVAMASFLIAITASIIGIVLYFFFKINNTVLRTILVIAFFVLFAVLHYTGAFEQMIINLAESIPMEQVSKRLLQIIEYSETGVAKDTTSRMALYIQAFNTVLYHPIFGCAIWEDGALSGHSTIMDIWGGCGIFVFIAFVLFYLSIYKANEYTAKTYKEKSAVRASIVSFIFIALFNTILSSPIITVLLILAPVMFIKSEQREAIQPLTEIK